MKLIQGISELIERVLELIRGVSKLIGGVLKLIHEFPILFPTAQYRLSSKVTFFGRILPSNINKKC